MRPYVLDRRPHAHVRFRRTFGRLQEKDEIRVVRIGRRVYVEAAEIERFIREHRADPLNDDDPAGTGSSVRVSADVDGHDDRE